MQDQYAVSRSLPSFDKSQDWFLASGWEENGRTLLEFNRNLTTCDEDNDMDIMVRSSHVTDAAFCYIFHISLLG